MLSRKRFSQKQFSQKQSSKKQDTPMKALMNIATLCLLLLSTALCQAQRVVTYYHNDLLGSPVMATNDLGEVLWKEDYRPYGERLEKDLEAADNRLWYTNKAHDEDSGLTYLGARYYHPELGRFMGVDPAGVLGHIESNPMMFNRYAYGNNNPYKFIDPDGRNPVTVGRLSYAGGRAVVTPAVNVGIRLATARRALSLGDLVYQVFNESNEEGASAGGAASPGGASGGEPNNDNKNKRVDPNTPKQTKPGQSGKEAARDVPSWAKGERPTIKEDGKKFAKRLLNKKYGEGNYKTGPGTEFNQIKKWGDRGFIKPK